MSLNFSLTTFLLGLAAGGLIAILAWKASALNRSGAWAAALTGGLLFGLGGLPWASLLLIFFITSSGLSRAFSRQKATLGEKFAKGSRRDWGQVLANDGLAIPLLAAQFLLTGQLWPWLAYAGAMATVNADTWATELGVLSPNPPRRITDGQRVERGASGGITLLGTLATLGGAALVALPAILFIPQLDLGPSLLAVTLGGLAGSLFDSLLGASVQAIYHCPQCQKETERHPVHLCGTPTTQLRGWRWLNNDLVNFISSAFGAAVTLGLWALFT